MSGNEVIVKASSKSHFIAKFMKNIFRKNKFRNVKFKFGKGKNSLYHLIDKVDFVFYMGARKFGRKLEKYCCNKEIEFLGEYEGNDWAIVFDGDLEKISEQIKDNVFFKNGRDCDSIKGVLVFKKHYVFLRKILKGKLGKLLEETPNTKDVKNPPFTSSLWIKYFNSPDELLDILRMNEHGLSICICDAKISRAINLAKKVNSARIIINSDTLDINPLIPWGGIKKTSKGGVDYWFNKFSNKKLIEVKY